MHFFTDPSETFPIMYKSKFPWTNPRSYDSSFVLITAQAVKFTWFTQKMHTQDFALKSIYLTIHLMKYNKLMSAVPSCMSDLVV